MEEKRKKMDIVSLNIESVQISSELFLENSQHKNVTNCAPKKIILRREKTPIRIISSKINIRTDIFYEDHNESVNISNELFEKESDDNAMDIESGTSFEISHKKKRFSTVLGKRYQKRLSLDKNSDKYLIKFYNIICPHPKKQFIEVSPKPDVAPVKITTEKAEFIPEPVRKYCNEEFKTVNFNIPKESSNLISKKESVTKVTKDVNEDGGAYKEHEKFRYSPKSRKKFLCITEEIKTRNSYSLYQSMSENVIQPMDVPSKIVEADKIALENVEAGDESEEGSSVNNDKKNSKEIDPPIKVVESKQIINKRKAEVIIDKECFKKQRIGDKSRDSIEEIKLFFKDKDNIIEVDASVTHQEARNRRRLKRPFLCPICTGYFRSEKVLQQHMARIHFWNKLLQMPKETKTSQGTMYQCSEHPCKYLHKMAVVVSGHLATEHKVVFRIALSLFPNFTLPPNPKSSHRTSAPVTGENNDDNNDIFQVNERSVSDTRVPSYVVTSCNKNNNNVIKEASDLVPSKSFVLLSNILLY